MQAIVSAIGLVLGKIVAFAGWLLLVVAQLFLDGWELVTDLLVWGFDGVMQVVAAIVSEAEELPGFNEVDQATSGFSGLPAEVVNMLGLVGAGYALGIIASALGIRFLLGLIPFIRVGG